MALAACEAHVAVWRRSIERGISHVHCPFWLPVHRVRCVRFITTRSIVTADDKAFLPLCWDLVVGFSGQDLVVRRDWYFGKTEFPKDRWKNGGGGQPVGEGDSLTCAIFLSTQINHAVHPVPGFSPKIHLRFIIQPMDIPVATPIAIPVAMPIENVAITVSTGCRCRRLIVSSMSSSAVSPPCFTMRRVAPKLSSSASARAVAAREACRAASAIWSPVHSATDCAMMY